MTVVKDMKNTNPLRTIDDRKRRIELLSRKFKGFDRMKEVVGDFVAAIDCFAFSMN